MLGHWRAFCLDCGAARRWFEDSEDELPPECAAPAAADAPPLPGLQRAVLVDVRGRLRGVRRGAARARAARDADPPAGEVAISRAAVAGQNGIRSSQTDRHPDRDREPTAAGSATRRLPRPERPRRRGSPIRHGSPRADGVTSDAKTAIGTKSQRSAPRNRAARPGGRDRRSASRRSRRPCRRGSARRSSHATSRAASSGVDAAIGRCAARQERAERGFPPTPVARIGSPPGSDFERPNARAPGRERDDQLDPRAHERDEERQKREREDRGRHRAAWDRGSRSRAGSPRTSRGSRP